MTTSSCFPLTAGRTSCPKSPWWTLSPAVVGVFPEAYFAIHEFALTFSVSTENVRSNRHLSLGRDVPRGASLQ